MSADMENVSEPVQLQDGESTDVAMNGEVEVIPESETAEDRPVRKAKRQLSRQRSGSDSSNNNAAVKKALPNSKNSRKSRDGRGRGLPKKGL